MFNLNSQSTFVFSFFVSGWLDWTGVSVEIISSSSWFCSLGWHSFGMVWQCFFLLRMVGNDATRMSMHFSLIMSLALGYKCGGRACSGTVPQRGRGRGLERRSSQ